MSFLERIAEQRIAEAIARGELDDLPGAGQPLDLDDAAHVPAELRVAYRILKNSGFVPPEVELRREISSAEELLCHALGEEERRAASQRLEFLLIKLAAMRGGARDARVESAYYAKLSRKLQARTGEKRS